jgi:tetratricopeptide (TPR) repeat protein
VPRGLALFPRSADLLALNAKDLRTKGKIQESLDATKQAVALDSTMAQGQLTVAQLEIELGRPDSALAALHRAIAAGEDTALVGQFALAKGNTLYRAASGTKSSSDFSLAYRFLTFADTVRSSVQSKFLVGAAALGVAQAAFTEAPKLKDKSESCRLAKLASEMMPVARSGLEAGQEAFGDAAKQSLDYLTQLDPYAAQALTSYCT